MKKLLLYTILFFIYISNSYAIWTWSVIDYYKEDWDFLSETWNNDWSVVWPTYSAIIWKINWAYNWDWIDDYVSLWYDLVAQSNRSFCAWINHDGKTSEYQSIFADHDTTITFDYNFILYTDHTLRFSINNKWSVEGTTILSFCTWY